MVLCCLFWCQSFVDVSPYVCSLYFEFGWGGGVQWAWLQMTGALVYSVKT